MNDQVFTETLIFTRCSRYLTDTCPHRKNTAMKLADISAPKCFLLGIFIKQQLEIWSVNESLKESCIKACRDEDLDEDNPAMVIVKRIWERLKEKYKLRVVE